MDQFEQETLEQLMPMQSMFPAKISLAMSYVPDQPFENFYDDMAALSHGTLFKSLDFPFYGAKAREGARK